jgi:GMP synthase (glutamine-hydrolysing)
MGGPRRTTPALASFRTFAAARPAYAPLVKPFLLLGTRAENRAADDEYAAFLRFGGLEEHELVRHRLERDELGHVELDRWSGIVLGGSPFTTSIPGSEKSAAQHRVEKELAGLLDEVVAQDFPFLGACYGVGTLGVHQGAVVDSTFPEPVGATDVALTPAGRADPLLGVLPDTFQAFVGHKEAVTSLPAHAAHLASSAACPVQAFRVGRNVYATQFHPELDVPGIQTRIDLYKNAGYFPPETAEDLKAAAARTDVRHPPRLMARFVELYARG